jgi:hypothetical protein
VLLLGPGASFSQSPNIFWTFSVKVQAAHIDGAAVRDVVTGCSQLMGIAVDSTSHPPKVYYSERGRSRIMRVNLDGSDTAEVITGVSGIMDLELDTWHRKIYWAKNTWSDDRIQRADMDGINSNVQSLYSSSDTYYDFFGVGIDAAEGKVYWTQEYNGGLDKIRRMNFDGTGLETIVSGSLLGGPGDVDVVGNRIYWTDSQEEKIMTAWKNGTGGDTVMTGIRTLFIAVDSVHDKMYWTEDHKIGVVNLDGTGRHDLVTGLTAGLYGIALYLDTTTVSVKEDICASREFSLSQNYPNPFNPSTTIQYRTPNKGHITLKVFDVLGREVATLVNEVKQPGAYTVQFDGSGLASGVYFYRLQAGSVVDVKKLIRLR